MIANIIAWSLKNRFLVGLGTFTLVVGGVWAIATTPIDALPDLSDVQVVIETEFSEQAPQIVEDQITYPIASEMLKVPGASVVRGFSFFGQSLVYVLFEDGTDLYWARSRVLEYLSGLRQRLPRGVEPTLGPDATGVGWVFEYVLESDSLNLAELRSLQDWYLRYQLTAVPGVSEVASLGGYVKQYQVEVDPERLRAFRIPFMRVVEAIGAHNADVGARVIEMGGREYMIRGLGYLLASLAYGGVWLAVSLLFSTVFRSPATSGWDGRSSTPSPRSCTRRSSGRRPSTRSGRSRCDWRSTSARPARRAPRRTASSSDWARRRSPRCSRLSTGSGTTATSGRRRWSSTAPSRSRSSCATSRAATVPRTSSRPSSSPVGCRPPRTSRRR